LGEYIVELCKFEHHDKWLDDAKDAFLKWKLEHGYEANLGNQKFGNR